jgi:hypothetical protein
MPTREVPGASLFNVSSIFPKIENSMSENPVTLRPGRARLSTAPDAIGSLVNATTIGIERVNFVRIGMTRSPTITMTSGFSATRLMATGMYLCLCEGCLLKGTIPRREQAVFTFRRAGMPVLRRNRNDRSGSFRQIDPLPTLSACLLRCDRVRTFAPQRIDAVCQKPTICDAAKGSATRSPRRRGRAPRTVFRGQAPSQS